MNPRDINFYGHHDDSSAKTESFLRIMNGILNQHLIIRVYSHLLMYLHILLGKSLSLLLSRNTGLTVSIKDYKIGGCTLITVGVVPQGIAVQRMRISNCRFQLTATHASECY